MEDVVEKGRHLVAPGELAMMEQNGLIREAVVDLHHRIRVLVFRYFTLSTEERVTGFPSVHETVIESLERIGDNLCAAESVLQQFEQQNGPTSAADGPMVD